MSNKSTAFFMQTLAGMVDETMKELSPDKLGFALFVFPLNMPQGARTNYVGNCNREDILVALKEIVSRWEGQPHVTGAGLDA